MNAGVKVIIFIVMVFILGGLWQVFNIGIESYNEAMDNQTGIDHNPYPNVTNLYNYLWIAAPLLIGMIATALYLISYKNNNDNIGGYY